MRFPWFQTRIGPSRAKGGTTLVDNSLIMVSCVVTALHSIQSTFLLGPNETVTLALGGRDSPVKSRKLSGTEAKIVPGLTRGEVGHW